MPESLDSYRPQCRKCGLAMHHHLRYSRSIATRYGVVELQVPVFRCGDCRNMNSGAELVSDDDRAIAAGIELAYGREAPHQLCQLHLLREYRRKVGNQGFRAARALLGSASRSGAEEHAREAIIRSGGEALDWCRKALGKGMTHLGTGQERHRTTSRLERQNREYRRREKMGTVWSPHNLLALSKVRGFINQTT